MIREHDMTGKEFIDLILPEHGRTSCSDSDPQNGLYTRNGEDWYGRCTRCMYLQILMERAVPDGWDYHYGTG